MQAIVIEEYGGHGRLSATEVAQPKMGPDTVGRVPGKVVLEFGDS